MLTVYRRHRAKCKLKSRKAKCFCPIWVQGILRGEKIRQSLDLTNWEAANKKIRDWEVLGREMSVSIKDAGDRWVSDCEARGYKEASLRKYREIKNELAARFEGPVQNVSVDDVRKLRESWTHADTTKMKRLELVRAFFSFCLDSGWIDKNPAKGVKMRNVKSTPTLPFSNDEWEKIVWAVDSYREIHPQTPAMTGKKLRALILLMRYSGLRISDAVAIKRERIENGRLFLYTQKTGKPVHLKLPNVVIEAIQECDDGELFWSGKGKVKSRLTDWQEKLKKVAKIAGIEGRGFAHRLRDSFSVDLLNHGTPVEMVAILLGNTVTIVQKHYAPWMHERQQALDRYVEAIWN